MGTKVQASAQLTCVADMLFRLLDVLFIFISEPSEGSVSDVTIITASPGEDVLLGCFFKPQTESVDGYLAVRWLRDFSVVHYTIDGEDLSDLTSHQFRGRTHIFPSQLSMGNASLLLQDVTVDDTGNYTCNLIGNTLRSTQSIQLDVQDSFLPSIVENPCVFFAILCVCLFVFKHLRKKHIKGGSGPGVLQRQCLLQRICDGGRHTDFSLISVELRP
ncbi:V-set domain-containing T-cell activation inhibitor 1-like isoform X2 [Erpetoichthys calabaricus]|uniref:V-set domain-containing T-cell activation inhibitor 1-like isoform X2 n=1 Tax=Erpetoichthys calabaricus TaxID=27687 RepID=UPI0010A0432C|nr:V-set domain-containing T-cell activation inhibitor 1-like isoform X2 [Erpetoichthys calabaricus]